MSSEWVPWLCGRESWIFGWCDFNLFSWAGCFDSVQTEEGCLDFVNDAGYSNISMTFTELDWHERPWEYIRHVSDQDIHADWREFLFLHSEPCGSWFSVLKGGVQELVKLKCMHICAQGLGFCNERFCSRYGWVIDSVKIYKNSFLYHRLGALNLSFQDQAPQR